MIEVLFVYSWIYENISHIMLYDDAHYTKLMCFAFVICVVKYYNGGFILEIAYSILSY